MNTTLVKVSSFTTTPGARYRTDGHGSAEQFFEEYLEPVLNDLQRDTEAVLIDFDDTWGYASSFKSELALRIAKYYSSLEIEELKDFIELKTEEEPGFEERFWQEVKDELEKLTSN